MRLTTRLHKGVKSANLVISEGIVEVKAHRFSNCRSVQYGTVLFHVYNLEERLMFAYIDRLNWPFALCGSIQHSSGSDFLHCRWHVK